MGQKYIPPQNEYFIMGKNKILISEHFQSDGKPLNIILEKIILDAQKMSENQLKH